MASNKIVIVLMPNGRRQNVSVTPNTTVLQILEEVCQKHKYDIGDYDLKHFNNVLDSNAILRFTRLPNNAQLEMVPRTKARTETNVVIGVQLESGERRMKEFVPNNTLADILRAVCPQQELENAVVIYMHREVCGVDTLEKTTLKSLGINSGRAMLRLISRDPQQPVSQAHVAAILAPKQLRAENDDPASTSNNDKNDRVSSFSSNETIDSPPLYKNEETNAQKTEDPVHREIRAQEQGIARQSNISKENEPSTSLMHTDLCANEKSDILSVHQDSMKNDAYKIQFLGNRNALVFDQSDAQPLPRDELPDNFYDLTVDDAKVLLRDAKRRREELEDAPLLTDAQRESNNETIKLSQLHRYRRTIIRVQFPDQLTLQGLFGSLETVQSIKDFIKTYLVDPTSEFEIYTSPPKHILDDNARLIDEKLVPSAIIHYSGPSALKSDIKEKLTDPRVAAVEALKSRAEAIRAISDVTGTEGQAANVVVDTATNETSARPASSKNQNKVPRWFSKSFK